MEMTLLQKIQKAQDIIRENTAKYPNFTVAFSGGKDSTVLLYLVLFARAYENLRIDAILSDHEFDETHQFIVEFENKFDVKIRRHFYIDNPEKPEEAGRENKVAKFKEVLSDVDCWFSGIRRDEAATRKEIEYVEERDGLIKVNPIADFTEMDVWRFLATHRIPINKKYKEGYRSLSGSLDSSPEQDGAESERDGRWRGSTCEAGECGIHSQSLRT